MFETVASRSRPNWKLRFALAVVCVGVLAGIGSIFRMTAMPLHSYQGALPALSAQEEDLRDRLSAHVKHLSGILGERNLGRAGSLDSSVHYLRDNLRQFGYAVEEHHYQIGNQTAANLEAILPGEGDTRDTVVVGGHYDSVSGSPGANDNGSGVAAVLELARLMRARKPHRSIRFVLFVNEEPPYFQTGDMGSLVYARQLHQKQVKVAGMVAVETIGYYSDVAGSQKYPPLLSGLYPNRGNFIAFVGNSNSRGLVRRAIRRFRESASFPSEGIACPDNWPGVGWSDHWSFWQQGYPAIMITDTAVFRYPYYHTEQDTADRLDFGKMARVVEGIQAVVVSLASETN